MEFDLYCLPDKVKVKLFPCFKRAPHHEGILGSGGIAPHILDLGTRCRWVVSFTPWPLYSHGNSPWYPLHRWLGGPQSQSGRGGEEKNSQPLLGLEHTIIQSIAHCCTTELSQLIVSLIMCSKHLVLMARSLVPWNWIQWHRCTLCSAMANLSGWYKLMCWWCSLILVSVECPVWPT
jgi:hypothetical protein